MPEPAPTASPEGLPAPDAPAEDAFVAGLADRDDLDALVRAITAAMQARRPRLAARLVGLLDDRVEIAPGSDLDRARRAAALLLLAREPALSQPLVDDLDQAWQLARQARMRRITARMRARASALPESLLVSPAPSSRRAPRLTGRDRRGG
ncbi:hypothetical protein L6R53_17485 [Myxococcota bacterium]|nr:hypothetical protein [Myxococcota bacterium]